MRLSHDCKSVFMSGSYDGRSVEEDNLSLRKLAAALMSAAFMTPMFAQTPAPSIKILLPERTRLLEGQLVDLVLEIRNGTTVSGLTVYAGYENATSRFTTPVTADLDCNGSDDFVSRANLQSFQAGRVELLVRATVNGTPVTDRRVIDVQPFQRTLRRNIILFIGDAMGTAYRDAARLVDRAIVDANGKNSFRGGYFDSLTEMDKMPVSGMSMTYGSDSIVPDSANTGSAWATGNKTYLNAVNVFEDGTDCKWRFNGQQNAANEPFMKDNPRVENLWQYLKRVAGYRTGIVSTASVTDATPAVEGAYAAFRQQRLEIARQFRENPMLNGAPAFDVILGGGADPFTAAGRTDRRDLIAEFRSLGYRTVSNATDLAAISGPAPLIGLFKSGTSPAPAANGIATATDANMDVAYDKLGLQRPASEPTANLGAFTDQPMLDLMTREAIDVLSADGRNFILMVEAASIDKQSHPNNAAGTIWDAIEMDRAVGEARKFAASRDQRDTLVVVTADHDQSMHIIGVSNIPDAEFFDRNKKNDVSFSTAAGTQGFSVYGDSYSNARAGLPFINTSTTNSNNTGAAGMPGSFAPANSAAQPETSTYSTYFGLTAYKAGPRGYPANSGTGLRRLAVGYRTGDHTGSSVPVTAEGPGALLFTGYMDQSDLFFKIATVASTDTTDLDKALDLMQRIGPKTIGK